MELKGLKNKFYPQHICWLCFLVYFNVDFIFVQEMAFLTCLVKYFWGRGDNLCFSSVVDIAALRYKIYPLIGFLQQKFQRKSSNCFQIAIGVFLLLSHWHIFPKNVKNCFVSALCVSNTILRSEQCLWKPIKGRNVILASYWKVTQRR